MLDLIEMLWADPHIDQVPDTESIEFACNDALVYVEMNGIATLRPADDARVFVTSLTFRTGDARYGWAKHRLRCS